MAAQFRELYQALNSSPETELVSQITSQLITLYENPESIIPLLELIDQKEDIVLRKYATVGLTTTISKCWATIANFPEVLNFLQDKSIQLLSIETDSTLRDNYLNMISQIARSECENWPQLSELIVALSQATDEKSVELFLYLFASIIEYMPITDLATFFENLWMRAKMALSSESPALVLAGSKLLGVLFTHISTETELIASLFYEMLTAFSIQLRNNYNNASKILNNICSIVKKNNDFLTLATVLPPIAQIIQDDSISFESKSLIMELIYVLIKQYPNQSEELSSQIIMISLNVALNVVIDACYDEQQDVLFSVRPIEQLSRFISPYSFFSDFWECVQLDSPNTLFAAAMSIASFIEHLPEVIALNFSDIFQFAIGCIKSDVHFVQESGFSILFQLLSRHYSLLAELYDTIMEVMIPILQLSDHEPLVAIALTMLIELLYLTEIPDSFIEALLQSLLQLISKISPNNIYLVFNALAGLIFSAKESIKKFIPSLGDFLIQAANYDPSQNPLVASAGIEALSYVISCAPTETATIHEFAFHRMSELLQIEDSSIFSSIMISLRELINILPEPTSFPIPPDLLFSSMLKILTVSVDETEKANSAYSSMIEAKEKSLLLITDMLRIKPHVIAPFLSNLVQLVINHMHINKYSTQKAALKTTIAMAKLLNSTTGQEELLGHIMEKLIEFLINNIESRKPKIVSLTFYGVSKLIKLGIQLHEETLKLIVSSAFLGLDSSLNCQQSLKCQIISNVELDDVTPEVESDNNPTCIDLNDEIFCFFAVLAQYLPAVFPFSEFFEFTQQYFEQWSKNEIKPENVILLIECIGVLCEYYAVASSTIQSLFNKEIRRFFFETMKCCIEMENPPHPISSVRCYIETVGQLQAEEIQTIQALSVTLLSTEFQGQEYYLNTIATSISLLLSMARIATSTDSTLFDIDQFAPKMLSLLPQNMCQSEAENIMSSLIWCSSNIPHFLEKYGQELLRILVKILSMKKNKLEKLKISNETLNASVQLFAQIRASVQQIDQFVEQCLDPYELERFRARAS